MNSFESPVYALSPDASTNLRISAVLNEASHLFDWHAEGRWTEDKDGLARRLFSDLQAHPKLVGSILNLNDRVFSMIVYRAVELLSEAKDA